MSDVKDAIDLSDISYVVESYTAAVEEIAKWTKIKDDLGKTLKAVMASAEFGLVDGAPSLRLIRKRVNRFAGRRFRDDFPELYDAYTDEREELALTIVKSE